MYKCPSCGDGLVFDPKSQKLLCPSCRNQFEPEKVENIRLDQAKEIENTEKSLSKDKYETISYKCSHCGAELLTTDETITTFCSFCRTGTMLDRKIIEKKKPDWIIPFKKTKKECEEIYINKIRKSFFAPKSMIDTQEVKKIRGIYMPYWIYSFEKHGTVSSSGSKFTHSSGYYDYYDDYSLSTDIDAEFSGLTHDATADFSDRLSESIAPFSIKDKKEFSPAYLSGFYADNEDIKEEVYVSEAKEIANEQVNSGLAKEKEFRRYGAKPTVSLSEKSAELALFPIYFLSTKNRKGDRISYAVINGQTGKIAADIPIDFGKFAMFSLVLAIPIFILLNMFLTISIPKLVICSIIFNIISLIVLTKQNRKIKIREEESDDKGLQYKKGQPIHNKDDKKKKKRFFGLSLIFIFFIMYIALSIIPTIVVILLGKYITEFISILKYIVYAITIIIPILAIAKKADNSEADLSFFKPVFGLLLTLDLLCLKPVNDVYYYVISLVSIVMTILSFYNIIEKFNILSTRKLPQLGKRGGDENA